MSCDISTGRLEPCLDAVGGIKAVYFVNYGGLDGITYDGSNDSLISELFDGSTTTDVYKFDLKGGSTLEQSFASSRENGTSATTQTLTLMLKVQNAATHNQLKLIIYGRPHVIVEYNTGESVICGIEHGCDASESVASLGAGLNDTNNYTVTLIGNEKEYANFLDGATAGDPFAGFTNQPNSVVSGT